MDGRVSRDVSLDNSGDDLRPVVLREGRETLGNVAYAKKRLGWQRDPQTAGLRQAFAQMPNGETVTVLESELPECPIASGTTFVFADPIGRWEIVPNARDAGITAEEVELMSFWDLTPPTVGAGVVE